MAEWKVLPHGELVELVPDRLWSVEGSLPDMPLKRNMIVYRLRDGSLLLHSVVCLDDRRMQQLEALGRPRVILVPNEGHRLDAPAYRARYPDARVLCPLAAQPKVEQVVKTDATCEDELPPEGIAVHVPPGFKAGYELIYEVDLGEGRGLIVNDVLANGQPLPGFLGRVFGLLGAPGGGFGRPRIVSFFFGSDRGAFKPFLEQQAARSDLVAITVSHGPAVLGREAVTARLREAIGKL